MITRRGEREGEGGTGRRAGGRHGGERMLANTLKEIAGRCGIKARSSSRQGEPN